jgi:hypothetical protein
MQFQVKNTLKNNIYHTLKHELRVLFDKLKKAFKKKRRKRSYLREILHIRYNWYVIRNKQSYHAIKDLYIYKEIE